MRFPPRIIRRRLRLPTRPWGRRPFRSPKLVNWKVFIVALATAILEVGAHAITLVVDDGNGGVISNRVEVQVITLGEAANVLIELVENTDLARQNKRPLLASLKAAVAAFEPILKAGLSST